MPHRKPHRKSEEVRQRHPATIKIAPELRPIFSKPFDLKVGDGLKIGVGELSKYGTVKSIHKHIFRVASERGIGESFQKKEYQYGLVKFKRLGV